MRRIHPKKKLAVVISAFVIVVIFSISVFVHAWIQEPQLIVYSPRRLGSRGNLVLYQLVIEAEAPYTFFNLFLETNGRIIRADTYFGPFIWGYGIGGSHITFSYRYSRLYTTVDIEVEGDLRCNITLSTLFRSEKVTST